MNHIDLLKNIQTRLTLDKNILGLLVFGSVSKNNHKESSDIDLIVVYKDFKEGYVFSIEEQEGIKLGFSRWSYDNLLKNVSTVPYLMYVFAHAKILYDPQREIGVLQDNLQSYFILHSDVNKDWIRYCQIYEQEKATFGVGKTPMRNVLNELENKYSGKERKRSFLD